MTLAFITPGIGEISIVVLILLLIFGAKRLPQLARALGSSLTEFKAGRKDGVESTKEGEAQKIDDVS